MNKRVISPNRIEVDSQFRLSPKRAKSAQRYGNKTTNCIQSSMASDSYIELRDIYHEEPIKYNKPTDPIFTDIISRKYEIRDESNSHFYAALNS
jgi:hypothetical protein